jgi:serralysin
MTNYFITTNQGGQSTGNGDILFLAAGVTMGGIDARGTTGSPGGGNQRFFIEGTVFGGIDDYSTNTSGNVNIEVGSTGRIIDDYTAILFAGGGNRLVNDGEIRSVERYAIYFGPTGANGGTAENVIVNQGLISSTGSVTGPNSATIEVFGSVAEFQMNNSGTVINGRPFASDPVALDIRAPGAVRIWNSGTIVGDVVLNSNTVLFDSRGGTVNGDIRINNGAATVYGGVTDDNIFTTAAADFIDGQQGADRMNGAGGSDVYVIDNGGDIVIDSAGTDEIRSSISFDLSNPAFVQGTIEKLTLTGVSALNAYGAQGNETITGNIAANTIEGGLGNDVIYGGGGNDALSGGGGSDSLIGGYGLDRMVGGADGDRYYIDSLVDIVDESEAGSDGIDTVISAISYYLYATATVKGAVENLTLYGSAAATAYGNNLNNVIIGNTGANLINGLLGNDTLTGGAGADRFYFNTTLNSTTNLDSITDFVFGTDKILLENAIFTKLTATGALSAANFVLNAAADANDYIIYNTTTGVLSYDSNGNAAGGAIAFADLAGNPGLTATAFVVL